MRRYKTKYMKTFNVFNESDNYTFFNNLIYKGNILYRGVSDGELKSGDIGNYFSESMDFAEDYGDGNVLKFKLNTNNVFNSLDDRNIKKLYELGYEFYDSILDVKFNTFEEYVDGGDESDTWSVIENSGALDWIMSNYDACLITEGGIGNYYIEDKSVLIKF